MANWLLRSLTRYYGLRAAKSIISKGHSYAKLLLNRRQGSRAMTKRSRYHLYRPVQPKIYKAKLRLRNLYNFMSDPGAGTASSVVEYSCNGITTPSATFSAGNPMGFDEMMAMYDHYTVVSSKIKFTVMPQQSERPLALTACVVDTATASMGIERVAEQYGARIAYINSNPTGTGTNRNSITKTWSAKRSFGETGIKLINNRDLAGSSSGNPNEEEFYHLEIGTLYLAADPAACNVIVEAEYNVIFHERKNLPVS